MASTVDRQVEAEESVAAEAEAASTRAEAGSIAIVPGGGPFADGVRTAQASIGYDDRAAHAMALMAMAQFGCALRSLNPALTLAASRWSRRSWSNTLARRRLKRQNAAIMAARSTRDTLGL